MQQMLLPVVEQILQANIFSIKFVSSTKKIGTLVVTDIHKNRCNIFGVPIRIGRNPELQLSWIHQRLKNWSTLSISLNLIIEKLMVDNNSVLLFNKYCAILSNQ